MANPPLKSLFNSVVAEYDSPISGKLVVKRDSLFCGEAYISTGFVSQSGWTVKQIWQPIIQKYCSTNSSWLILGVAGATVPRLIAETCSPSRMVGVEIDPIMVKIAEDHFGLHSIPNFQVVIADAAKFVFSRQQQFDYLLVDIYVRDQLPKFVYQPKFVSRIKQIGRVIIFNHLYYLPSHVSAVSGFVKTLDQTFTSISLVRQRFNLFIICS